MAMATKSYEVLCDVHGVQDAKCNYRHKSVMVGRPRNKKDRRSGGCPRCHAEKISSQNNISV